MHLSFSSPHHTLSQQLSSALLPIDPHLSTTTMSTWLETLFGITDSDNQSRFLAPVLPDEFDTDDGSYTAGCGEQEEKQPEQLKPCSVEVK